MFYIYFFIDIYVVKGSWKFIRKYCFVKVASLFFIGLVNMKCIGMFNWRVEVKGRFWGCIFLGI